ncbi:unnamed protein product [Peronospora effusa]|nr:unnamed protein product [Peronospora effusa]
MSPTIKREAGAAAQAKPTKVTDGFNKTAEKQLEDKSAAPMGAMDKMMGMLGDISESFNRLESSQKEHAGKNFKGPLKFSPRSGDDPAGLGGSTSYGFIGWGKEFVRQVGFAERACGFAWLEYIKVDVLGQHLRGKTQIYYRRQVESWWVENQTLDHVLNRMLQTFSTKISPAQSMKLFTAPKAAHKSWMDHYLYLTAVSDACGGMDNLVLQGIVNYADPNMRMTMLSRLDIYRPDSYDKTKSWLSSHNKSRLSRM